MTTFDALAAAQALEASGIDRRQAEAIADVGRKAAGADRDELATKADLEAGLAAVKADIYRMMTVQTFAIVGAVVALVKLIP